MNRIWFADVVRAQIIIAIALAPAAAAETPVQQAYLKASNADANDVFGEAVAISGNTMVVGATFENGDGPESGAAYVFVRDGSEWQQQALLKASNPDELDLFGGVVAISGDTIAIGASGESGDASSTQSSPNDEAFAAGAVYVFERTGSTWNQTAFLKASNAGARDLFGSSIAMSGDTIAVGAFGEAGNSASTAAIPNDLADRAGAVYVFERNGASWTQTAYIKASNAQEEDSFGHEVAICGDRLIAGAWSEDGNELSTAAFPNNLADTAGAAYIFERNPADRSWSQAAYLKASNADPDDRFGISVAISGNTAVVGAIFEDGDATSTAATPNDALENSGAAYLFECVGSTWSQAGYLKAGAPGAHIGFASSGLAIEGNTIVIGSPGEDPLPDPFSPSGEGAAYIFQKLGTSWSQRARLKASNPDSNEFDENNFLITSGDQFGAALAISGSHLIITSPAEAGDASSTAADPNNDAPCAGAAYLFQLPAPQISSIAKSPGGVQLEIPFPCSSSIGVEYSPDLSTGSWIGIGDFLDPDSDGIGSYTDPDPSRNGRAAGFYRGVLK